MEAKRGETNAHLTFLVTNVSASEIIITGLRPSCTCTTAKLPSLPWRMAPGDHAQLEVSVDVVGKRELINKGILVETSSGTNRLSISVRLPEPFPRERNQLVAFTDRQAVFKGACAECHLHPSAGKMGGELFKTICGICHDSEQRATMVADLAILKNPTDRAYWEQWIRLGKPGTFMPAFSKPFGGTLTDSEITSLVNYLLQRFPSVPGFPAREGTPPVK